MMGAQLLAVIGTWPWIVLTIPAVLLIHSRLRSHARRLLLPPGPTPLPLVGNIFDMPRKHLGREAKDLCNTYGNIVYLNVLGKSFVILGSYEIACELLDKRSANYSDRPKSMMVSLCGLDWMFVLMNYGPEWRTHRRAFHQQMNSEVIAKYEPLQTNATRDTLRRLLESPKDWDDHLKFSFAAVVLRIVYGIELHESNDKYFAMVERVAQIGEQINIPGRFPVEAIPWLRFLPSWFPGAGFKKFAADAKRDILFTLDFLFDTAKEKLDEGLIKESFVSQILDGISPDDDDDGTEVAEVCKGMSASTYIAGAETSHTTMRAFFLAMTLYPEVQRKAQAELDAVVGPHRLPEFGDRHSLPYTCAVVKELLRWHIVTPVGVPHNVVDDDEYKGYIIPGGATIVANAWAISRDPETYPDPENFFPERFIDQDGHLDIEGKDPASFVFGFGRRICPGRHFAESSLFIMCASLLWAFDISPPVDTHGNIVQVERKVSTDSLVSHAPVYDYTLNARSAERAQLVLEMSSIA